MVAAVSILTIPTGIVHTVHFEKVPNSKWKPIRDFVTLSEQFDTSWRLLLWIKGYVEIWKVLMCPKSDTKIGIGVNFYVSGTLIWQSTAVANSAVKKSKGPLTNAGCCYCYTRPVLRNLFAYASHIVSGHLSRACLLPQHITVCLISIMSPLTSPPRWPGFMDFMPQTHAHSCWAVTDVYLDALLQNLIWNGRRISISLTTSYGKTSRNLEAAIFVLGVVRTLWNLTGVSAALLPSRLSNFKAIW